MAPPLLSLRDVSLGFGGNPLFEAVELGIGRGERVCLVGRNGSGKSTLLKIMAGLTEPDRGERVLQTGVHVAYLPQEPDFGGHEIALDYVAAGLGPHDADAVHRAEILLTELGLAPDAATASLSGGEARRAAIARALVSEPDILLLDEPTNHLDLPAIRWLEDRLAASRAGFVVISHDRAFLDRLTRVTLWLDRGRLLRLDRGFAEFEAWAEDILTREETERHKLDRLILQETRWSHEGISARRKRNQGRLRRLHELRAQRSRQIARTGSAQIEADAGGASGRLVIEALGIAKSFDGKTVIRDFSTRILRGDRIGLIGPNGAGKTTLLRLLTGEMTPDKGTVRLGTNLTPTYLDQKRQSLRPEQTVWDFLCDMGGDQVDVRGKPRHVVSYLRDFLFEERQARSPLGSLSGGERNRLLLAKALARPSNLLILDEPTNDLDMDTLDLLQEVLTDYDGTLLLVSHDRDFLDRVVTSTIVFESDGEAREYPGGYSDYLAQRAESPEPAAEETPQKPKSSPPPKRPSGTPTKLSNKQVHALKTLPGTIKALERELAEIEAALARPDFYVRDPEGFAQASARLVLVQTELEQAEHQWLELELLRETLEEERRLNRES